MSPARRRARIERVRQKFRDSERFVCRVLVQHRATQREVPQGRADEEALAADIIALASQFGRCRWWPWPPGLRLSRLVFIGHYLDEFALRAGLEDCLA